MCLRNINKVIFTGSPDVLATTMYAELSTNSKTRWLEENNWALYIVYYIFYKLFPPAYEDIVIDFGVYILRLLWTMLCGPVQSVQRLATGWAVRGTSPGGGEVFRTPPDWLWGPPSPLYNGCWVFLSGVKWPERGVNHQSPSSAEVKEIVELYLYSASGASLSVLGWTLPLTRTA
jgi:hypothetical protein